MNNTSKYYAVFAIVETDNGFLAATTRPYDDKNGIGLPGGKVEKNETAIECAIRESKEEGWLIENGNPKIIYEQKIEGHMVAWVYFEGSNVNKLENYLEKNRKIIPVSLSVEEVAKSGYGNDKALEVYLKIKNTCIVSPRCPKL